MVYLAGVVDRSNLQMFPVWRAAPYKNPSAVIALP